MIYLVDVIYKLTYLIPYYTKDCKGLGYVKQMKRTRFISQGNIEVSPINIKEAQMLELIMDKKEDYGVSYKEIVGKWDKKSEKKYQYKIAYGHYCSPKEYRKKMEMYNIGKQLTRKEFKSDKEFEEALFCLD